MTADVHANEMHVFRTTRNVGNTNSTPANPNQNQELSIEFKGVSTVKVTQPVPAAREWELSLGGGMARGIYQNRQDSSEGEGSRLALMRRMRG